MAKTAQKTDKRKVTMRSVRLDPNGVTITEECIDYVPLAVLEAYMADARSRWQFVEAGSEPDAGPGGVDGDTDASAHLKDITETGLQAAHEAHVEQLLAAGESLTDPVDAPSPVTMTTPGGEV